MKAFLAPSPARQVAVLAWLAIFACEAGAEQRVLVDLNICEFRLFDDGRCSLSAARKSRCSVTLSKEGRFLSASPERRGDDLIPIVNRFTKKLISFQVCGKEGSEIRVAGTVTLVIVATRRGEGNDTATVKADESAPRLCFKKTPKGWAYVAGSGTVHNEPRPVINKPRSGQPTDTPLGKWRTVDSCLATLDSQDEILREGCARDLGRLAAKEDHERVAPALSRLLKDPVADVRAGAAEGLGQLAVNEATKSLLAATATEADPQVKERIGEALAVTAGTFLLGFSENAGLSREEAVRLFRSTPSLWVGAVIAARHPDKNLQVARIEKLFNAPGTDERLAAVRLAMTVARGAAVQMLDRVAQNDQDNKVKEAAKSAAEELREKQSQR